MKLHSVFLRSGCILPHGMDPLCQPFGETWTHVEEIAATQFDSMVRQAGWHFMWIQGPVSRMGFGLTEEQATHRALASALKGIRKRFNAAELESVHFAKYPGFQVAHVVLQPRQIQQHTSLDVPIETRTAAVFAR